MFDVCGGCGEYSQDKQVLLSPTRCQCGHCGFEQPFRLLPDFFVTGASGSGKTSIALEILKTSQNDFLCLDQDILWNDSFNNGSIAHDIFRNTWVRLIKNLNQSGKPVMLFGSTIPEQIENCPQRCFIGDTHYLALVCQVDELGRRLRARPSWRHSGTDENVDKMIEFNDWLLHNAESTNPKMCLFDTTSTSVTESAQSVMDWFKKRR
jgi:shikimate kinase